MRMGTLTSFPKRPDNSRALIPCPLDTRKYIWDNSPVNEDVEPTNDRLAFRARSWNSYDLEQRGSYTGDM